MEREPVQQSTEQIQTEELEILPIFTEKEVEAIQTKWQYERLLKDEDNRKRLNEEEQITTLSKNELSQRLIQHYDEAFNHHLGLNISETKSPDDIIILLRHHLEKKFLSSRVEDSKESDFRKSVVETTREDLIKARIYKHLELYFSSYPDAIIATYPLFRLQIFEFGHVHENYWNDPLAKATYISTVRWLIEDILRISKDDPLLFRQSIISLKRIDIFSRYRLYQYMKKLGFRSPIKVLQTTYPELKLLDWEFNSSRHDEEDLEIAVRGAHWLVEIRFGLSPNDPAFVEKLAQIQVRHFKEVGLSRVLQKSGLSHIDLLAYTYQINQLKAKFARVSSEYWKNPEGLAVARQRVRDLVEKLLSISPQDDNFRHKVKAIKRSDFDKPGLRQIIYGAYNNSYREAIRDAFPEIDFMDWEFHSISDSTNFWSRQNYENVAKSIRWVVEEVLHLNFQSPNFKSEIAGITRKLLEGYGLDGMFSATKLSLLEALQVAYPELDLTPDDLIALNPSMKRVYDRSWTRNKIKEAIIQIYEKEGNLSSELIERHFGQQLIRAIFSHFGSMQHLSNEVNLDIRTKIKPKTYWTIETITAEALGFYSRHDGFSVELLAKEGREDLRVQITLKYPGGMRGIRRNLNLLTPREKEQFKHEIDPEKADAYLEGLLDDYKNND